MICQNDGEEAKSISLTKRYTGIFMKVNLNVFSVAIKFYRIYITNLVFTFSVYKKSQIKILEIPGGRGVIKDSLERKKSSVGGKTTHFIMQNSCSLEEAFDSWLFVCGWLLVYIVIKRTCTC